MAFLPWRSSGAFPDAIPYDRDDSQGQSPDSYYTVYDLLAILAQPTVEMTMLRHLVDPSSVFSLTRSLSTTRISCILQKLMRLSLLHVYQREEFS